MPVKTLNIDNYNGLVRSIKKTAKSLRDGDLIKPTIFINGWDAQVFDNVTKLEIVEIKKYTVKIKLNYA